MIGHDYVKVIKNKDITIAIEGFGNVGSNVAKFLEEQGIAVVAWSNSKGGTFIPENK